MSLQVRLRHALDEQVFDLEPRTLKRPILIGRSSEADLQVPSLTVAPRHCVLFVHGGQWMAQSLASGGATAINGARLKGAVGLRVGDLIAVGDPTDEATIEIDPAGAASGQRGMPVTEGASDAVVYGDEAGESAAAAVPSNVPWQAGSTLTMQATPAPPPVAMPLQARRPAAVPAAAMQQAAPADQDAIDWETAASTGTYRRRHLKKQSQSSGTVVWIVIVTLLIGGATAAFVYMHPAPTPPPVVVTKAPDVEVGRHRKTMFDPSGAAAHPASDAQTPDAQGSDAKATGSSVEDGAPKAVEVAPAVNPGADSSNTSADSTDADWAQVQDSAELADQGLTILKIDDYTHRHPGMHVKEIAALQADALDQLWWKRLTQVLNRKDKLEKDIAGKTKDIRDEPDPTFKKQLSTELVPMQEQLNRLVHDTLAEDMGFTASTLPDVGTKQGLAEARAARNASVYATWSKSITHYIRVHNGQTPWGGPD